MNPRAPIIERTLKIIPRVQAQPLPCRKPKPTASQMRLNSVTIAPRMRPNPEKKPPAVPKRADVEIRAESPITAIPARSPKIPMRMARMASMVIPFGLDGFCSCTRVA